jgi:hypothetical protein
MASGDEERGEGRHGAPVLQRRREEMSFHMVHPDHRPLERRGERLAEADPDEQRPDQSRTDRHGHRVDGVQLGLGFREGLPQHGFDRREMRA